MEKDLVDDVLEGNEMVDGLVKLDEKLYKMHKTNKKPHDNQEFLQLEVKSCSNKICSHSKIMMILASIIIIGHCIAYLLKLI